MTNENGNRTPAGGEAVEEKAAFDKEREIKPANGERRKTQPFIGNPQK
jgi:hypothetical protein